jgi:RND family efflux transporter MFP subunit
MTTIARTIDYTSTIMAYEEVNLAPSTPGRVDEIYVEVGDRVQKGQKLFLMDRTQYYANKIQLANLEKDLARLDTLLKVGSVKEQLYDQTKAQYEVMKTNVVFMEENTQLEAPFTGIITGRYLENGELYSGAPGMSGKAAVVTLMQINPVKIIVSITEQYFPLIRNGMKVRIASDIYPDRSFEGTIFRVHPTIDPMSRSFSAEVRIANSSELLRPGMFARSFIDMGEEKAIVVPANAVLMQEGTNERYIFVLENGIAVRKTVILGQRFDDRFEIAGGTLKEGESLITEGQARLNNGQKVEISE